MTEPRNPAIAALLLRVSLGTMFVAHALLKYFVFTLPGNAQFFESLGLPGALGYLTFAAELVGGVLLIAGVQVRTVALALVPILIGATWVHAGNVRADEAGAQAGGEMGQDPYRHRFAIHLAIVSAFSLRAPGVVK